MKLWYSRDPLNFCYLATYLSSVSVVVILKSLPQTKSQFNSNSFYVCVEVLSVFENLM